MGDGKSRFSDFMKSCLQILGMDCVERNLLILYEVIVAETVHKHRSAVA
jgi:hypothetical protein